MFPMTNIQKRNDAAKGSDHSAVLTIEHLETPLIEAEVVDQESEESSPSPYTYLLVVNFIWPDGRKRKFRFEELFQSRPVFSEVEILRAKFLGDLHKEHGLPLYSHCEEYLIHNGEYHAYSELIPMLYINGQAVSTFVS
jgi:hypothetical protein